MLNRYIIERDIPGVGASTDADFGKMAGKSNEVLSTLAPKVQWIQSFITDDKVYCEYLAENEDLIRDHAKQAGFPANKIAKVTHVCDPTETADEFSYLKGETTKSTPDRTNFLNN